MLDIELSEDQAEIFSEYEKIFLEKNSYTNLISKNDEKFLFEKHIFDSLALNKFFKKIPHNNPENLLDFGTGGGFPAVPLSILYRDINVFAVDSIKKKIKIIEELKNELKLGNLFPICDRVENLKSKNNLANFEYATSRAVAPMDLILKYAMPNLKSGGYFIAYKSKKALEEINEAEKTLKRLGGEVVDIIEYTLPLDEVYERNLIVVKKK